MLIMHLKERAFDHENVVDMGEQFLMKIAVASGKGGTGKTTIATNLAFTLSGNGQKVAYLDCDVEEPNGHIFLRPEIEKTESIGVPVPEVDREACSACGECGEICNYSAIVLVGEKVLTFPELCHGCGGCSLVCPEKAIREVPRETGLVEEGRAGAVHFVHGRLRVGEAMSPPLIRAVKQRTPVEGIAVFDAPPGTSCPVIESVRGADFVLLVTEPTPFGLHDLGLAVEMLRKLQLPFGVIINRSDVGDDRVGEYCEGEEIPVLLEIPDDRRIAEAYSRGEMAVQARPEYRRHFTDLFQTIAREVER